ncbi:ABC transporter permease [Anaerococcus cruorum]|uniref:ABC transporter permease n=1 Tax=Anaerococcus sp. WGS1529 TaxID=3366812 RepID=UPI00372D03DC
MQKTSKKVFTKPFIIAILLVIALAIASVFTGAYDILKEGNSSQMIFITRIPRTLALMLAAVAMSLSGIVMQLISQNKLVEPTTTGTIEWAGLGLVLVYILIPSPSLFQRMTGAIIASFIGSMVFFYLLKNIKLKSSLFVPIVGIMLGAVISAVSTFIGLEFNMTQVIEVWFQGSFAPVQRGRYEYLFVIILITIAIYRYADKLTIAGLGEDITTNLGLNYNQIILRANILIAIACGIVAAVIGNIPFLGLIVPNLVSLYRGDDLRANIPWVCLVSMIVMLVADILSRIIIAPFELPVSLILGSAGSIIFIIILLNQRRFKI